MWHQRSIIAFQCFRQPQNVIEYFIDGRQYDNAPVGFAALFSFTLAFFIVNKLWMKSIPCFSFVDSYIENHVWIKSLNIAITSWLYIHSCHSFLKMSLEMPVVPFPVLIGVKRVVFLSWTLITSSNAFLSQSTQCQKIFILVLLDVEWFFSFCGI